MTRQNALLVGLCIYAFCSLGSMATMSIGAAILLGMSWYAWGGPSGWWTELKAEVGQSPTSRRVLYLSLFLVAACFLSLVVGKLYPVSYGGRQGEIHLLKDMAKSWYLFWPLVVVVALRGVGTQGREKVVRFWLLIFGVMGLIGVQQYFTGWPRPQIIPLHANGSRYHATLFLGHHLSVSSVLIFPFFACLDLLRTRWKKLQFSERGFFLLLLFLGAVTLFFTFSRMLWVSLGLGVSFWLLWVLSQKWRLIALVALIIGGLGAYQVPFVKDRLTIHLGKSTRSDLWEANIDFFKKRPLTGVGWHRNGELSGYYLGAKYPEAKSVFSGHAHNNFLQMAGGTGLVGLIAWLAFAFFPFLVFFRSRKDHEDWAFPVGLLFAWLVFHLNGLTQVNFWEGKVLHQAMWMLGFGLVWANPRRTRGLQS